MLFRSFSDINPNILIKSGNTIKTISEAKNVLATAVVDNEFPQQFGIYDLKEFISVLSLVDKPNLKFAALIKKYSNGEDTVFLVKDKKFIGLLDTKAIDKIVPKLQQLMLVKQLAVPLKRIKSVRKEDNCYTAFKKSTQEKAEALPVMNKSKLEGFLTRRSLMHRLVWELKYGNLVKVKKKK